MIAKAPTLPYTIEPTSPNVLTVRLDPSRSEWWFLLQADEHWDNPKCDRAMLARHHDEAVERGAGVCKFGDTLCVMQGKYDKRSDKSAVRPEHQCGEYLDAIVRTAVEWYGKWAANLVVIGRGNHEQSIRNRHETDLIDRIACGLRDKYASPVQAGGYTGWIRFMLDKGTRTQRRLWYMHGYGGGGPVTLDTIQAQRQATYIENADIMVTGHTHDSWAIDRVKIRLNDHGKVERRELIQVKTATYKEEYQGGEGGWHVETGKPPKPLGAYWLRLWWHSDTLHTEVLRAR